MTNIRKHKNKKEMYSHVVSWKESGLTQKEYSIKHSLGINQLSYWNVKYQKDLTTLKGFLPIEVSEPQLILSNNIEISFPNGVTVLVDQTSDVTFLKNLIKSF